jgi:hypothetical protein
MNQEFTDKLRKFLDEKKLKYHLVVMQPFGNSSRYCGEHHDLEYIPEIADEVLGDEYIFNAQRMFRSIADSLRVSPSGLVIPQGHGDIDAISNLEAHFGAPLPNIPIFLAIKNAGGYLDDDGRLLDSQMKSEKDDLVKTNYRNWLLESVKPHPIEWI